VCKVSLNPPKAQSGYSLTDYDARVVNDGTDAQCRAEV
jgi:hypothetical protein